MSFNSSPDNAESTFGTDPWDGADETLFDRTDWEERTGEIASRLDAFEATLTGFQGGNAGEENRRLHEVIDRLQARIYSLEDALEQEKQTRKQARVRILKLIKEFETWKPSEP